MAINILPRRDIGEEIGTSFSGGLTQRLGQLDQQKKLEQAGLPGVLAFLDPQVQAAYLREYGSATKEQSKENQEQMLLNQVLQGLGYMPSGVGTPSTPSENPIMNAVNPNEIGGPETGVNPPFESAVESESIEKEDSIDLTPKSEPDLKKIKIPLSPGSEWEIEKQKLKKQLQRPDLSPKAKSEIIKRMDKDDEKAYARQKDIDKGNEDFIDGITKARRGFVEDSMRLGRMKELIHEDNLPDPENAAILETLSNLPWIGTNLRGLLFHQDAQEFNKLSKDFAKSIKQYVGSRVTQGEIKMFLETFPDLMQSDEGKLKVINNMELFGKAVNLKYEATQDIIKENYGHQPKNIEELVNKRTEKEISELMDKFKEGLPSKKALQIIRSKRRKS